MTPLLPTDDPWEAIRAYLRARFVCGRNTPGEAQAAQCLDDLLDEHDRSNGEASNAD